MDSKTSDFISKSINRFGSVFDYTKTVYINAKTKVTVTCPFHGDFEQLPGFHLKYKNACKECSVNGTKVGLDDFISRSKVIHNNVYSYDNFVYINTTTKSIITCPIHGEFEQTPYGHLKGYGCIECGRDAAKAKTTKPKPPKVKKIPVSRAATTEQFIDKARKVYGDLYDYSKVSYMGANTKVEITCKTHGSFNQRPADHLRNHGCPECGKETFILKNTECFEEFVRKARCVHGDKYQYVEEGYRFNDKIDIICKTHGVFTQRRSGHLSGRGCRHCGVTCIYSRLYFELFPEKKETRATLYLVKVTNKQTNKTFWKVGITTMGSLNERFGSVKNRYYIESMLEYKTSLYNAFLLEQECLTVNGKIRFTLEDESFGGRTECFLPQPIVTVF